jgi:hypothetical protein
MRKRWFLPAVTAVILIAGGYMAPVPGRAAQTPDPEQRIANQQKRIDQALQANEITPDSAKMLQDDLNKIKDEMTRMKADGKLSKEETDKLNTMLHQNGQLIDKTKKASKAAGAAPAAAAAAAPAAPAGTAPAAATPATAPPKPATPAAQDPGIKQAIADQQKMINQGVQSKQLTLQESKTLEDNLNQIRAEDTQLRADGDFTQADKDQVLALLDQNEKMIKDKKKNPVKNLQETRALDERAHTIPERFTIQQKRIDRGVKSKELTQAEAKVLEDNLNYIKNEEARLKASGKLSEQEKNRLHILLDQNSEMIRNKKQNPVKALK